MILIVKAILAQTWISLISVAYVLSKSLEITVISIFLCNLFPFALTGVSGKSIRISLNDCKLCEENDIVNKTVKHNCPKRNVEL